MRKISDTKAYNLLKKYRIKCAEFCITTSEKKALDFAAKIGYPVVLKISSEKITHKTDIGGVITDIKNEKELKKSFKKLMKIKNVKAVIVQEQLKGIETIVGISTDSVFDKVIMFGLGGIFVEVLRDVSFRLVPISPKDAEDMIKEIKGHKLFQGVRGLPKIDMDALKRTLLNVSKLAIKEKIKELDINPLFVNEKGAFAADVRIFV